MQRGFTIAEILVVLSILLILAGVTVPAYPRLLAPILLDAAEQEVTQLIRLARVSAEAGERDASFGVFIQPTRVTLFQGASYAARDAIYDRVVEMHTSVLLSGMTETIFAKKSGLPSVTGAISLTHTTGAERHLLVNSEGLIERITEGVVTLIATADSTMTQNTPSTPNGAALDIQEYPWNSGYNRRGLLRFSMTGIPTNATISNAILSLRETGTYGSTRTVGVYRMTNAWTETGVTWLSRDGLSAWTAQGGDFVQSPTATQTLSWDGSLDWATWDVTADVQGMVAGSVVNNGWLVKDLNEDTSQAYWFFSSREGASRPTLAVTYAL